MKRACKALVTGGAGFIGSHIVDQLIKRGIETFVIDNLSTGSLNNIGQYKSNTLFHLLIGDISNIRELLKGVNDIDIIFHEAAIVSVRKSVDDPLLVHHANVNSPLELMNYCLKAKVKRFVFASSAAVYGNNMHASEDQVCRPFSPYGASKLAVENYLDAYRFTYGLETVVLRYFNVFGPRQTYSDYSGVIVKFIKKILNNQSPNIFGDGKQVRDFVNVRDIALANILAMDNNSAVGEILNIASGNGTSILKLFEILKSITGCELQCHFAPSRPGDIKRSVASIEKASKCLGYIPRISLREGLTEIVEIPNKLIKLKNTKS